MGSVFMYTTVARQSSCPPRQTAQFSELQGIAGSKRYEIHGCIAANDAMFGDEHVVTLSANSGPRPG